MLPQRQYGVRRRGRSAIGARRRRAFTGSVGQILALCYAAASLLLWAKWWRQASTDPISAFPGDTDRGGWHHGWMNGATGPLDVVSVSVKPTCVTARAVAALNRHLAPRDIHVVSVGEAQCAVFAAHAPNVRCWLQDTLLPGVTKSRVGAYISARFGRAGGEEFMGRNLEGWYLQQFLKLGAVAAIPGLSEHFIIWDLDMIAHRRLDVLQPAPGGGLRALVNVGGANAPGYASAYRNLFGKELSSAPGGSSFVTHWIVVNRALMAEFLGDIGGSAPGDPGGPGWVWRILDAVEAEHVTQGFSEYASYVSWVHQRYPETQVMASRRTWLRYPVGGRPAIRFFRLFQPGMLCCPSALHLWATALMGYTYTGYEIGHMAACGYSDGANQGAYGLPHSPG
eukprot:jgi/Tetstr1/441571/TSEL_029800.t1